MSFYCFNHQWSSPLYSCPECHKIITSTSDQTFSVLSPQTELEQLRAELAASQERETRLRGALKFYSHSGDKFYIGHKYHAFCGACTESEPGNIAREALSSTPEPRMLTELRAARDGLAECAADTETHDGCRGCKKDLTRLDAFLESIGENK